MFRLNLNKKEDGPSTSSGRSPRVVTTPAMLRLTKDLSDLDLPPSCSTEFPNPDNLSAFNVLICPDEGYYKAGKFWFSFVVGDNYPISPPKVKCITPIYHPNIDMQGNVCLNILKEEWSPVLTINSLILGLLFLFMEPNVADPLNQEAANVLKHEPDVFQAKVHSTMRQANLTGEGRSGSHVRTLVEAMEQLGRSTDS